MKAYSNSSVAAAVIAGLTAGTIDIGIAVIINWLSPVVILQAIASGVFGRAAFFGGIKTAFMGLIIQLSIAILIALIYLALTSATLNMRRLWIRTGTAAGITIFLVMNYIVVPLSRAPFRPKFSLHGLFHAFTLKQFAANLLAMILFGLIIGFILRNSCAHRKLKSQTSAQEPQP